MTPLEEQIVEAYVAYDTPSDTIRGNPKREADLFALLPINHRRKTTPSAVSAALINLRKSGRLPRIRDRHGPNKGSGGGHHRGRK